MHFCFVDRIESWEKGGFVQGYKNISVNNESMQGHFPGYPVFPGTQTVEALAQLSGFLLEMSFNDDADNNDISSIKRALLVRIEDARFQHLVKPGDKLDLRVEIESSFGDAVQVSGAASVDGETVTRVTLSFLLKTINKASVHERQRRLYSLWSGHLKLNQPIL